jgi:predicted NAD-dependent protein-ADP-ribosyltransferase YbiA (DUF1768 family)/hypoxanthine phosphoribosyltransferase
LVIFCAALKIASAFPNVQTIVGLPSGGTELAFLIHILYDFPNGSTPTKILLPLSFHSVKDIYGERSRDFVGIASFLDQYRPTLSEQNVLICDDNSSTGRTLQHTHDAIKGLVGNGEVSFAVAEIDIIRSLLDRDFASREYVANPIMFDHSINILPVSRRLRPKTDIKELMEKKEIIRHHSQTHSCAAYREVMMDVNRHDTTEVIERTPPGDLILNIQGTPLSNFYAIPIVYREILYPSVEHAYQHQKFTPTILRMVDVNALDEIRESMRLRGFGAPVMDLNALFTDDRFNAGNIKIVADVLRKHGYGKELWADARVKTMIALLLLKFADRRAGGYLLTTKGKTIIEGNNWDDTLWGYCEGRGRNLLGRILMNIRDRKTDLGLEH